MDPFCFHLHPLGVVALNLIDDLDHPSGIDNVIRSIEYTSPLKHPAVTLFVFQLVICRTGHDFAFQFGNGLVI